MEWRTFPSEQAVAGKRQVHLFILTSWDPCCSHLCYLFHSVFFVFLLLCKEMRSIHLSSGAAVFSVRGGRVCSSGNVIYINSHLKNYFPELDIMQTNFKLVYTIQLAYLI